MLVFKSALERFVLERLHASGRFAFSPWCSDAAGGPPSQVDCVITPSVSQNILGYSLVAGEERAVELARQLKAT